MVSCIQQRSLPIFYLLMLIFVEFGCCQNDECKEVRCADDGPAVRFPFRIKGSHPRHCGYPGFDLSCTNKATVLQLPTQVQLFVQEIDYKSQVIHLYSPDDCLPRQIRNLTLSASPFHFGEQYLYNTSFFSCPLNLLSDYYEVPCLIDASNASTYQIVSMYSGNDVDDYSFDSCTKMYDLQLPSGCGDGWRDCRLDLKWSEPALCRICERKGHRCRFVNNGTDNRTECFNPNKQDKGKSSKLFLVPSCAVLGFFFLLVAVFGFYRLCRFDKNQAKIEKFLEDYKALKPTRYSYADIKRITNGFIDKLGQGAYGTVFKGKLSNEVLVAVKILTSDFKGSGEDFVNEVGIMGRIHHVNVVRLAGFCADGFRRALVYEFLPNESLEKFIFAANGDGKANSLGWEKLQEISLGIAKGIEYLHQGCDQRILHFNIKPHNILLDHNFVPKVCDFGLAKLCSKDQSVVSMTAARGTTGYIAPEVVSRNFGKVSHKSDVYSYGMLLLEMVGGRKNKDVTVGSNSQGYFPEWIYKHLEDGDQELRIRVEKEAEDCKIVRKLSIIGLWCIQWNPADRPSMNIVVQMLAGKEENLTMPPNPFASRNGNASSSTEKPFHQALPVIDEIE